MSGSSNRHVEVKMDHGRERLLDKRDRVALRANQLAAFLERPDIGGKALVVAALLRA